VTTSSEEKLRADLAALRVERSAESTQKKRRPLTRNPLVWLALAILVAFGVGAFVLRATPVKVAPAQRTDAATLGDVPVLTGSGYIVPGDKVVAIGTRVPGRVERYLVDDGSVVKAGDPLVQLDNREYRAALDRTQAQLEVARANLRLAESELARGEELAKAHYLAASELDIRRNKVEVSQATIHELEAALAQTQVNLDYTILRAPTDGVVLAKLKEAGEIVVPGGFAGSGELVRLANLQDLRTEVDVNESDLSQIHLHQRAQVTPDADTEAHYEAQVVKLYPQVDRQKGTLKVEVRILEPDGKLLPDMSARVAFLPDAPARGGAKSTAVLVPAAALRRENDGRSYVWVVDDGHARRSDVETAGLVGGDRVRITRGLNGDEKLIVGTPPASDGERVSVVP
jgi:RND family efflux transporter MFP subunit